MCINKWGQVTPVPVGSRFDTATRIEVAILSGEIETRNATLAFGYR